MAKVTTGGKTMEIIQSIRYRVNVSTSVKGIKTFDCTVDAQGLPMDQVLIESDKLVDELQKRYPITVD